MNPVFTWRRLAAAWGLCAALAPAIPASAQAPISAIETKPLQAPVTAQPVKAQPANLPPSAAAAGEALPSNVVGSVGTDYRLAPNDLLEFDIYGVPDMKRDVRVNASGLVSLPLIGPIFIAGMTAQDAEAMISSKYGEKYLQNPQVSLFIKEFTTQRITIEGAVLKPGIYPVMGQLTLLRALALAGGFVQYADVDEIMLYRIHLDGKRESFKYNLDKVRSGEVVDPDIKSDDVIVVKRDSKRTALRDSLFRDIIDTINPFSNR
jgi:polysaccharide biosynthesis/export protein